MDIYSQERKIILKDLIVEIIFAFIISFVFVMIRKYLISIDDETIRYLLAFFTFLWMIGLLQKLLSISVYIFMYKKPKYFYTDLYKVIDIQTIKDKFISFLITGFVSAIITSFILVLIESLVNKKLTTYFNVVWGIVLIGIIILSILDFIRFLKKVKEDAEYADGYKNSFNFNQQYYSQQQSANQQYNYSNQYNTGQNNNSFNKKEYNKNKESVLPSYYKVLGFNKKPDSFDDIKLSYRRLVKVHHPDRGGDMETMQKINDAYESAKREWNK